MDDDRIMNWLKVIMLPVCVIVAIISIDTVPAPAAAVLGVFSWVIASVITEV